MTNDDASPLATGHSRIRHLALPAMIAAVTWLAWSPGGRATEAADSGWQVATPLTQLDDRRHADPEIRIAINRMLRETQTPLLHSPAPVSPPPVREATAPSKPALRPLSTNGWRPAGVAGESKVESPESKANAPAEDQSPPAELELTQQNFEPQNEEPQAEAEADDDTPPAAADSPRPVDEPESTSVIITDEAEDAPGEGQQKSDATSNLSTLNSKPSASVDSQPSTLNSQPATATATATEPPVAAVEPVEAEPLPPLPRNMVYLRNKIRRVLKGYYNKPLNSRDHDSWEMMHGMLSYGVHSRTLQGGPRGAPITSVGWLCYNRPCKRLTLLTVTPEGELRAKYGVGLQGHMGQFLAMLAQCKVSPDYPIRVGTHEFTIRDLVEAEKTTCYEKDELTFKLISLMHYLDSDAEWVNDQGLAWDIPKLIREELSQPIRGAACGGTHRLAGLSLAARTRVSRGEPLDGEFARADAYVERYHNYAFRLQNRDGSLSTEWFRGRGDDDEIDRRIKTTGHILEWLIYSLDDDRLQNGRTVRAVSYLANLLYSNYDHEWEIGPRSHALHALALYDERVFAPYDDQDDVATNSPRRPATSRASTHYRRR